MSSSGLQLNSSLYPMLPAAGKLTGYQRLLGEAQRFSTDPAMSPMRHALQAIATEQHPKVLLLTCMDSRVQPTAILNTAPGEVFEVRNAGNNVDWLPGQHAPSSVAAAISFAVSKGVTDIVVLGHSDCGAVKGVLQGVKMPFLSPWLQQFATKPGMVLPWLAPTSPGGNSAPSARMVNQAVKLNVAHEVYKIKTLLTHIQHEAFSQSVGPIWTQMWNVAQPLNLNLAQASQVRVHGWFLDLAEGKVTLMPDAATSSPAMTTAEPAMPRLYQVA
jgi:carbonic anhydrase